MATTTVHDPDGNEYEIEHPEGATDDEIINYAQKNFESVAPSDFSELPGNIPKSVVGQFEQFFGGIKQMVQHPIDTGSAMLKAASGGLQSQPGVGGWLANEMLSPLGADVSDIQVSDALVKDTITDPYGSWDKARETLINDPARPFGDAAMLLSGGALAPIKGASTLGKAAGYVDPIGAVGHTVGKVASLSGITPAKMWESATKIPPSSVDVASRQRMTETALKEGIEPTYKGVEKANKIIGESGTKLDTIIKQATDNGTTVPKSSVMSKARLMLDDIDPVTYGDDVAKVTKQIEDTIARQSKLWENADQLTPTQVQIFKRKLDEKINYSGASKRAGVGFKPGVEQTRKGMRDSAKGLLEELDPQVSELNQRMSRLFELRDNGLESAAGRIENRDIFGLSNVLYSGLAGVSFGVDAGVSVALLHLIAGNPKAKAKAARILNYLKTGPMSKTYIVNNALTRQGAIQLERLMNEQGALAENE